MSTSIQDRDALIRSVTDKMASLSEAQRRVALFVLNDYARVPFMTTTELARAAGTSQSSVTRFVLSLGFEKYADFSAVLSHIVLAEVNETLPARRFVRSRGPAALTDLLDAEIRHLDGLRQLLRTEVFERCAERISTSPHTVVAGFAASTAVAVHTHLYLSRIQAGVSCVTQLTASVITELVHLTQGDCAVMFAVPRYIAAAADTLALLNNQGVHITLVTDRSGTDLAPLAHDIMVVPITNGPTSAVPAAMLTLGMLLVEAVALRSPERTLAQLDSFERSASVAELFTRAQRRTQASWEAQLEPYTHETPP